MSKNLGDNRLIEIKLEDDAARHQNPDVAQERRIAVYDLLENNYFCLRDGKAKGPYELCLKIADNSLIFEIQSKLDAGILTIKLSMTPFRTLMKDYAHVCESYFAAIKAAPRTRIEAIDMGRRALHDEGSHLLQERLKHSITIDFDTARRLFTVVFTLHIRG